MSKTLFAFCSFVFLATDILVADTIRFKNGAYIEVDKASEKDGQIEYWMGNTRYTIPSTKVEKITKGDGPSIKLGSQVPVKLVPPSTAEAASRGFQQCSAADSNHLRAPEDFGFRSRATRQ